eukprot:TRINITY_DN5763_c1_g2_i3.p1 TRINITY_DN5763_c1_g2~~TRINITY_DN5763_c1_g2_i3.p1  ORF type:complete len:101 (+),score=15.26 TRINITY_DN5763_c1_g2_i3:459-761(+)
MLMSLSSLSSLAFTLSYYNSLLFFFFFFMLSLPSTGISILRLNRNLVLSSGWPMQPWHGLREMMKTYLRTTNEEEGGYKEERILECKGRGREKRERLQER